MDSATAAAWVAAAAAVAALLFAIWSAVSSHRAARSTAESVAIERARRRDELEPDIRVEDGDNTDDRAGIWFTNASQYTYPSVWFQVVSPAAESPVAALQINTYWRPVDQDRPVEGGLGPMAPGDRRFVPYRRAKPMPGTTLRLRVICANEEGAWPIYREVEISPDVLDTIG